MTYPPAQSPHPGCYWQNTLLRRDPSSRGLTTVAAPRKTGYRLVSTV